MDGQEVAPPDNANPAGGNSTNYPQGQVQSGQNNMTLPQRSAGFGPQYLDSGGWDFPSSDLE
jgi:hypothetical protein